MVQLTARKASSRPILALQGSNKCKSLYHHCKAPEYKLACQLSTLSGSLRPAAPSFSSKSSFSLSLLLRRSS